MDIVSHPLHRLMQARSIAMVGASANVSRIGGRPIDYMLKAGFSGRLYPVNPKYTEIAGLCCYSSVESLPEVVDVVLVSVPARHVPDTLRRCGRLGIPFAVVFSSGFAEIGPLGADLQREMMRAVGESGIRVIGPNSLGYSSAPAQIIGSFASTWLVPGSLPLRPGSVSFVTHSGAFGAFIYGMSESQGVNFRHFVNVGNECDMTFSEVLEYMVEDPEVRVIGGYIEGIQDGDRFVRAAMRAKELRKPLVFLKVGRSERARQAAESHTAHLVGTDSVYEAIFRECNIIRVEDVQHMLDILCLCQHNVMADDPRLGIISISGGTGVWAADQCGVLGLRMADFTPQTRATIDNILPVFGSSLNPVDATAQLVNDPSMFKTLLKAILADPGVDLCYFPMALQEDGGERFARDAVEVVSQSETKMLVTWVNGPNVLYEIFREAGIPVIQDFRRPLLALQKLAEYHRSLRREQEDAVQILLQPLAHKVAHGSTDPAVVTEHAVKALLAEAGIPVPRSRVIHSQLEAVTAALELGLPVVMKAAANRVLHKSDLGLVKGGLDTPEAVAAAHAEICQRAARILGPSATTFVEAQAPEGVDFIVSLFHDPVFGFHLVVGAGGELVELIKEVGMHRVPLTRQQAGLLLAEQRAARLLQGYRSRPPADVEAFIDLLVQVSHLPASLGDDLEELELNPVRVHTRGKGCTVLDAVLVRRQSGEPCANKFREPDSLIDHYRS